MSLSNSLSQFDPSLLNLAQKRLEKELGRRQAIKRLEGSLIEFFEAAWPAFDPAPFTYGWHLEAIAEHLEAVNRGEIRKLVINIPPRCSKTSLVQIAWPAWTWIQREITPLTGPQVKFLCLTYAGDFAREVATTARRLIDAPWFQERWGDRVKIASEMDKKERFDTTAGGSRISTSFEGQTLGRGGDIKIIDDPIKVDEVESETAARRVVQTYDEALSSRVTDPRHSAEVVIMQRLGEGDLSGHILSKEDNDVVHLCLPMRYEDGRKCVTVLGFEDPREQDGELLWPDRHGVDGDRFEAIPLIKSYENLPYLWAGQYQQRPEPRGGGIFKREWWRLWEPADGKFPTFDYLVASLDSAFTENEENDPSGLTVWGVWNDGAITSRRVDERTGQMWTDQYGGARRVMLVHAWRKHLEMHGEHVEREPGENEASYMRRAMPKWGLVEWTAHTCRRFKVDRLLIEAKASGITAAQEMRRLYSNETWTTEEVQVKGDKVARAHAVVPAWSQGLVYAPDRDWATMVIDEMATFPKGRYKDLTDSSTQAIKHLRELGLIQHEHERLAEETGRAMLKRKPTALYPA